MKAEESKPAPPDHAASLEAPPASTAKPKRRRRWWPIALGLLAAVLLIFGIPRLLHALNTVSTDDAYVNGYVTFVAPRVIGQVARVLVDDNNRVKKGDVLVELDPEPYQVQVAIKQAAVDSARANLVVAQATVPRAQLRDFMRYHLLRLWSALRIEHVATQSPGIALWL